nr:hypothetical protein [Janthinobacterium sp. 35]
MASLAGTSATTFHLHFKHVTSISPMQYLKLLRLVQASATSAGNRL